MTRPRRARRPSFKMRAQDTPPASNYRRELLGRQQLASRNTTRAEVVVPTLRQVQLAARYKRASDTRSAALPAAAAGHEQQISQLEVQPPPARSKSPKSEGSDDANPYFLLQATIKAEIKPEDIISQNVARDRLAQIGYETFDLDVSHDVLNATTTRKFTSRIWGGSMRATLPKISPSFTHGLDDFMYVNLLCDPHAPRRPGSPGLLLRFRDDGKEWPKIMRVIVRLRRDTWQYMGQYRLTLAPPLTPGEWRAQSVKVKQKWAKELSGKKADGGLKAKIALWKRLGRDPTPQEVAAAQESNERFQANADEILRAYDEGRAVVHVWCMKCVGYDVNFQGRIARGSGTRTI